MFFWNVKFCTRLHGILTQKTVIFIVNAVRTLLVDFLTTVLWLLGVLTSIQVVFLVAGKKVWFRLCSLIMWTVYILSFSKPVILFFHPSKIIWTMLVHILVTVCYRNKRLYVPSVFMKLLLVSRHPWNMQFLLCEVIIESLRERDTDVLGAVRVNLDI